jgi:hypothetical protein
MPGSFGEAPIRNMIGAAQVVTTRTNTVEAAAMPVATRTDGDARLLRATRKVARESIAQPIPPAG